MVNYNNSIIYKLCCKDINITEVYVGSTTNFNRRKQQHKNNCSNENGKKYKYNVYQFIRNNRGFENWDMVEIEKYNCNDKRELHKRERYYIDTLKASLNKMIPTHTRKEWLEKNKDILRKKDKEYYEKNKDKREEWLEKNKDRLKEICHCDCGGKYTHPHKSRHFKTKKHLEYLEKQKQH